MDNTPVKIPDEPLGKIALSFSGGGYRAASFHLGTLSYLQRLVYCGKPLLENVKMLSTVSGGTITGIVYALMKKEGKSFDEVYDFLISKLSKLDLVKLSIEKLNPNVNWDNTYKRKNLINAFALLYDEHFTNGATFSSLNDMNSHLEAVVFNSTEFNNAIDFRFRNKGTGFFGNYYSRVKQVYADEIKLADAMAASSCFPGGFEPILWPSDFIHENSPNLKSIAAQTPTGLMDGGIYDNQGIDSVLKYKSKDGVPYFDLILISDVASPYMEPYQPAEEGAKTGVKKLTIKQLYNKVVKVSRRLTIGLWCAVAVFSLLPLLWGYGNTIGTGVCVTLAVISLGVWTGKWCLVRRLRRIPEQLRAYVLSKNKGANFFLERFKGLKVEDISVHRARPLLMDRFNSLLSLLLNVFLKIVRRLNYGIVYDDERLEYRRASTLIRALTEEDYRARASREAEDGKKSSVVSGEYKDVVGEKIKAVAEAAGSFGTTLWFTDEEKLDDVLSKLVATG
ncbi:MAG TPA: patatin-like phospholipase family protein, partial [Puia sp.]